MSAPPPQATHRIFVAGATGVLGRRAVRLLVEAGHQVTGIARSEEKAALLRSLGVEPAAVDLFDPTALTEAVAGHDVVANLATHIPRTTKATVPGAWKQNDRIRTEGARNLVDAALATGAQTYLQESISFVYDDQGDRWIDEDSPATLVPYVRSAAASLGETERFTAGGGRGVFLRFALFYAADGHHTQDAFRFARRGLSMEMGAPDTYKTMLHVDDAAAAVLAVLATPDLAAGIYNVGESEPLTRGEHDELLAGLVGRPRLRHAAYRTRRLAGSKVELLGRSQRISSAKLRAATGWAPRYPSVREGYPAVLAELGAPTERGAAA